MTLIELKGLGLSFVLDLGTMYIFLKNTVMNGSDCSFRKFEPRCKVDMRRAEITAVSPSAGRALPV